MVKVELDGKVYYFVVSREAIEKCIIDGTCRKTDELVCGNCAFFKSRVFCCGDVWQRAKIVDHVPNDIIKQLDTEIDQTRARLDYLLALKTGIERGLDGQM